MGEFFKTVSKSTVNGTIRGTPDENVGQPYLKDSLSDLAEIL